MYQLIYASIARRDITETDILDILTTAGNFNSANGITGCLVYHKKEFIQILEGDSFILKKLYLNIVEDQRHSHVTVMSEDETVDRIFKDWAMCYYKFNENDMDEIGMKLFKENFLSLYQMERQSTITVKLFWHTIKHLLEK